MAEEKGWAWLAAFVTVEVAALGYLARKIRRLAAAVDDTDEADSGSGRPRDR